MEQEVMLNHLVLDIRVSINQQFMSPLWLNPVNFEHCSHKLSFTQSHSSVAASGDEPWRQHLLSLGRSIPLENFHQEVVTNSIVRCTYGDTPLLWAKISFPSHKSWFYHSFLSQTPFPSFPAQSSPYWEINPYLGLFFLLFASRKAFIHTPCLCPPPCTEAAFH